MTRARLLVAFALAASVLPIGGDARGQESAPTYYVAPTGSDAADGSEARPFKTLSRAGKAARPGATKNTVTTCHTGIIVGGGDFDHATGPNDNTRVFNTSCTTASMGSPSRAAPAFTTLITITS